MKPCDPVSSVVSVGNDYQLRNRTIQQQDQSKFQGLHGVAGCARQGRIRIILSSRKYSTCSPRFMGYRPRTNRSRIGRGSSVQQSRVCESAASKADDDAGELAGKQQLHTGDQCSENSLQAGASFRQVVSVQKREGEVLLNLPIGENKAPTNWAHRYIERNRVNALG